jgi:hypothetical protein
VSVNRSLLRKAWGGVFNGIIRLHDQDPVMGPGLWALPQSGARLPQRKRRRHAARPSRMRKNAVLATRFVEFSWKTRAVVAENRVSSRRLH